MSRFETRKQTILDSLAVPEGDYTDLSPKGTVDVGIRELVDEINALHDYVTTSSCAGRVAVYEEGGTAWIRDGSETSERALTFKTGSKGGGRWLFVSHDPLLSIANKTDADLLDQLGLTSDQISEVPEQSGDRFVHLKFEPMILHVLCSSISSATRLLAAAMAAGFRESGISSINNEQNLVLTAVRTNGLAFDSIIGTGQPSGYGVRLAVTSAYIRMLLEVANSRFAINKSRMDRFRAALLAPDQLSQNKGQSEWEPAEARKARKRAEGLQRRQQVKQMDHHLRNDASSSDVDTLSAGTDLLFDSR